MTTKTTIKGSPAEYSQAELTRLQEQRANLYLHAENYEYVKGDIAYNFLMAVIEKEKEGYTLCSKTPINMMPLAFRARMIKPQEIQEAELTVIYEQTKTDYFEALKKEREDYKKLLVQQLMEAEEEKERKRQEQAKAKKLADFEKQADECYGEMQLPEKHSV
ncbi:hypothetical protein FVE88_00025 [Ectopseudomonas mendocina]|nr:hypothetical protein [Pseudomonas mendocina]TXR41463.1 hypothetical protein FVE88_00025 [Pseudomonas mendocina]